MSRLNETSRPAVRTPTAGMTLVELLVVIVILALLAGLFPLAIERMRPARRLTASAQTLGVHLRDLQSRAMFSGQALRLVTNPAGYDAQRLAGERPLRVAWLQGVAVTLRVDEHAQTTRTLLMYPDGSSSGGRFTMQADTRVATVTVHPLTGRVRVSR